MYVNCNNLVNMENLRWNQTTRINSDIKCDYLEIIAEDIIALTSDRKLFIYDMVFFNINF
jgi:hypothetical protein